MKKVENTFENGMNKDTPFDRYPNNTYYHAENMDLFHPDGDSKNFSLKIANGNYYQYSLGETQHIHGKKAYTQIGDKVVFICRNINTDVASIVSADIGSDGQLSSFTTLWTGDLNFSSSYPVKDVISFYESEDVQRIYWTDGYNSIRGCNIADTDLSTYSSSRFEILPPMTQEGFELSSSSVTDISGNLECGAVQYAYSLYNPHESETLISVLTSLRPIFPKADASNDSLFIGGRESDNSGRGLRIKIQDTGTYDFDTDFSYVKIYRIFYGNILSDPIVNVVYDAPISVGADMYVEDVGVNLDTITFKDFKEHNYDFICQALGVKNNILFAASVEENVWDVEYDARAYRWAYHTTFGTASIVFNSSYTEYIRILPSGSWARNTYPGLSYISGGTGMDLPDDFDCVNAYNDESNAPSTVASYNALCQYNTSTVLGGTGPNVSFTFSHESLSVDRTTTSTLENESYNGYTNADICATNKSYMRDEIYSFSLILVNAKGQASYPKWICDIRMPSLWLDSVFLSSYIRTLYPLFNVTNLPADCEYYQIVRCKRDLSDRTIVAQGVLGGTRVNGSDRAGYIRLSTVRELGDPGPTSDVTDTDTVGDGAQLDRTLLEFISPEINFGNEVEFISGDYLNNAGFVYSNGARYYAANDVNSSAFKANGNTMNYAENINQDDEYLYLVRICNYNVVNISTLKIIDIPDLNIDDMMIMNETKKTSPVSDAEVTIGGKTYYHYNVGYASHNLQGTHGKCAIIKSSDGSTLPTTAAYNADSTISRGRHYYLFNYKRDILPYGGYSYEARSNRVYIPAGSLVSAGTPIAYEAASRGDTYITPFEYARTMVAGNIGEESNNESYVEIIRFFCESSINTRARSNKSIVQNSVNSSNAIIGNAYLLSHEEPGVYSKDDVTLSQDFRMYEYNSVYSRDNDTEKYYPDTGITVNTKFSSRIHSSGRKYRGDIVDAWTKWNPLSFIDVESQLGEITCLSCTVRDLVCFQKRGVSLLSVDERQLTNQGTGIQLTLGVGGVLDRFDYIDRTSGTSYPNSVSIGSKGVYYYDNIKNVYSRINNNAAKEVLTRLSGNQGYMNEVFAPGAVVSDVFSGVDNKYGEIIFVNSVYGVDDKILIFNEDRDKFIGVKCKTYTPSALYTTSKFLYSYYDYVIYLENTDLAALRTFYGEQETAKLVIVVNPDGRNITRFDITEWDIYGLVGDSLNNFNKIRIYNSYQDSGEVTLTEGINLERLMRKYRFNQMFDSNNDRFRDSFVVIELILDDSSTTNLNISGVTSVYSSTAPF